MTDWKTLLATCESEKLHLSSAIQPHGYLVNLSLPDLRVVHASANLLELLGRTPAEVLGQSARSWLGYFDPAPLLVPGPEGRRAIAPFAVRLRGQSLHAVPSRSAEGCLLELHPTSPGEDLPDGARLWWPDGYDGDDPGPLWRSAANAVRAATGLDRVMIYRFAEDWSGEVVAESLADGVAGYLGLRFPASDIPQIARNL